MHDIGKNGIELRGHRKNIIVIDQVFKDGRRLAALAVSRENARALGQALINKSEEEWPSNLDFTKRKQ